MNLGSIKDKTENHKKQARKKIASCIAVGCVAIVAVGTAVKISSPKTAPTGSSLVVSATAAPDEKKQNVYSVLATPAPDESAEVATEAQVSKMMLPVSKCNVLKGYASDMLLYSDTLKHWCTHTGLDLKADEGAEVMCALDGTVAKVEEDALMGNCVTIQHENGYETYYASLDTLNDKIVEGAKVLKGQSLGTVGTSAASEFEDGTHLHFEVFANGKSVDPQDYLSDLTK